MMSSRRSEPSLSKLSVITGKINRDTMTLLIIILFAVVLRVIGISWRPISNDEASHIYFGLEVLKGKYAYDPEYHGPLEHYVIALTILILKGWIMKDPFVLVWAVRLSYTVFSLIMIVVVYVFFRDYLGKLGSIIAALLFSISPEFLYYSRFAHEDIISVSFAVMTFIFAYRFYMDRQMKYLYASFLTFALLFATKENWLLYLGIWMSYVIVIVLIEELLIKEKKDTLFSRVWRFISETFIRSDVTEDGTIIYRLKRDTLKHLLIAFVLSFLVAFAMYSYFVYPEKFVEALLGPFHWVKRHHAPRIIGPLYYWFDRIWLYELFLLPGIILAIKKHRDYVSEMLLWWFVISFVGYSYMQEKLPRLMMHITAPAILLVSKYLGGVFSDFGKVLRKELSSKDSLRISLVSCLFIILLIISAYQSVLLNYINYDDVREPLIYARLTREWQDVYRTIEKIYSEKGSVRVLIEWEEGDYGLWPILFWLYYVEKDFREINVSYVKMYESGVLNTPEVEKYDIIICYSSKDQGKIHGFKLMGRFIVLKWIFHEKWTTETTLEGFIQDFSHYLNPRFYFLREYDSSKIETLEYWAAVYLKER